MRTCLHIPVVLVVGGNDPSGGAGLQADLEALVSHGCHAAPVISALTVQDTTDVRAVVAVPPELVLHQAQCILEDLPITAVKVGLLGSAETPRVLATLLAAYPRLSVVLDPVLRSGGGTALIDSLGLEPIRALLPLVTVLTPNSEEARRLAGGERDLKVCGRALVSAGAQFVLITGAHEDEPEVVNRLFGPDGFEQRFGWPRLPHLYHGSGCTLAASIAALLARGVEPAAAVQRAQAYTWQSLRHGYRLGKGQHLPHRLYWMRRPQ